jgi:hypothetical protein
MRAFLSWVSMGMLIVGAGCAAGESGTLGARTERLISIPFSYTDTAVLGQGVDSLRYEVLGSKCVTGTAVSMTNTLSDLRYSKDMSFAQIASKISGNLEAGLDFPTVKAGGAVDLAKQWGTDTYSETHHVYWVAISGQEFFQPGSLQLSETGAEVSAVQPQNLYRICGDEYIAKVYRGAFIMATMRMDFVNAYDKTDLAGKLTVDVGTGKVDVDGSLAYASQKKKERTQVTIGVRQFGGDPQGLLGILDKDIMTCSMANMTPCIQSFQNLIVYMRDDFRRQLAKPESWNILKYETRRYDETTLSSLVPASYPVLSSEVEEVLFDTEQGLVKALRDAERAGRLRTTAAPLLTSAQYEKISAVEESASYDAMLWRRLGKQCYTTPDERCVQARDRYLAQLKTYDLSDLDIGFVY